MARTWNFLLSGVERKPQEALDNATSTDYRVKAKRTIKRSRQILRICQDGFIDLIKGLRESQT